MDVEHDRLVSHVKELYEAFLERFCLCKLDADGEVYRSGCGEYTYGNWLKDYKYCPYCGKRIRVVEYDQ